MGGEAKKMGDPEGGLFNARYYQKKKNRKRGGVGDFVWHRDDLQYKETGKIKKRFSGGGKTTTRRKTKDIGKEHGQITEKKGTIEISM